MTRTLFASLSCAVRNALIMMAGFTMLMAFTSPAMALPKYFVGVRCQSAFQDNWAPTLNVYSACDDYINWSAAYTSYRFYFNLQGAQTDFYYGDGGETCFSCGGVDSVDIFFMMTHGGINGPWAAYAMWDDQTFAYINNMRLGDSGDQVKVFATFACDTFKSEDGLFWARWKNAFSGGLKLGVGGHDLLWDGNDTQATTNFAQYVQNNGTPIGWAWLDAVYYANDNNNPAVANTGANSTDCWNRQNLLLPNIESESILRDGQIGYWCATNWEE